MTHCILRSRAPRKDITAVAAALLATAVALTAHDETVAGGVIAGAAAGELALGVATRWTRRANG